MQIIDMIMVSAMPRIELIVPEFPDRPFSLPMTDGFSAVIGRDEGCDICIPIASVSSRHAVIKRVPGGIELSDLGSTNGLLVEGERVEKVMLSALHHVILGEATLVYSESAEEKAQFDSEEKNVSSPAPVDPWAEDAPAEKDSSESPYVPIVIQVEGQKANYIRMVVYAIVVFILAAVAGMTYQHYKRTGNLLPLIWMGNEPRPVEASDSAEKAE